MQRREKTERRDCDLVLETFSVDDVVKFKFDINLYENLKTTV